MNGVPRRKRHRLWSQFLKTAIGKRMGSSRLGAWVTPRLTRELTEEEDDDRLHLRAESLEKVGDFLREGAILVVVFGILDLAVHYVEQCVERRSQPSLSTYLFAVPARPFLWLVLTFSMGGFWVGVLVHRQSSMLRLRLDRRIRDRTHSATGTEG